MKPRINRKIQLFAAAILGLLLSAFFAPIPVALVILAIAGAGLLAMGVVIIAGALAMPKWEGEE